VLDVEEDYVYLLAGVPGEQPPYEVVRGLQDRASQIARQQEQGLQTDGLWAESYFILSPGRELNVQEIQQYINFYRM
jgi:REP element-mobilizing transposase RayT